jgi:hypothetical protein
MLCLSCVGRLEADALRRGGEACEMLREPERPTVVDPHRLERGAAARESLVVRSEHGLTGLDEPASRDRDGE